MTRKVFEYFFEPEELEPFYSQLPDAAKLQTPPANPARSGPIDQNPVDTENEERRDDGLRSGDGDKPREEIRTASMADDIEVTSSVVVEETVTPPTARQRPRDPQYGDKRRSRVRQLLSVHALGQYVYCVRSAILASELGDEADIDEPLPRLTYLPNFDRHRIEEMLREKLRGLGIALLYGISMVILMVVGVLDQSRLIFYPAMFAFLACVYWFAILFITTVRLIARRRAAITASAQAPEPSIRGIQPVNWWSMLKAGYEPVGYQRPFRHPELPLEGRPWRVLEQGSRRIPVIRSGGAKLGSRQGAVYEKHRIRLAAYALLLEAMGSIDVPYGLVFPTDSPRGLAVPITKRLRAEAVRLLHDFSRDLDASQQHQSEPRLPEQRSRCTSCKYGEPTLLSRGEIDSARLVGDVTLVLRKSDGREFHCKCGDRFGSAPPHSKSVRLGLSATLD